MELTPRQAEFADAALGLLARQGMASVSFRSVAAEAGVSLGAVQKAFPSKDVMLRAMFARLRETASGGLSVEPGRPTVHGWLVELMVSVLPLDEARRAAELQGAAFADRAAFDPVIGAAITASDEELGAGIAQLVVRAQAEGAVPATVDPAAAGWAVLSFMQGMASQLLYNPVAEDAVRRQCEWVVDAILHRPGSAVEGQWGRGGTSKRE